MLQASYYELKNIYTQFNHLTIINIIILLGGLMNFMYFLGNYLLSTPLTMIEFNPDMDETTYIGRLEIPVYDE
jgi:hypothetical protein